MNKQLIVTGDKSTYSEEKYEIKIVAHVKE